MRTTAVILWLMACAVAASAQTQSGPETHAAEPSSAAASQTAKPTAPPPSILLAPGLKVPRSLPAVREQVKTGFTLRYQDIKIGAGAVAEPNKLYKVFYTGYLGANGRADDGQKFDSTDDHRKPEIGSDGKPVSDAEGKPKMGDPQPFIFPQGYGRLIPGWDQGFAGMRIGGKRRIFVPWQLGYGALGRKGPDAAHPGIPPLSDLIFDVELLDVTDMPSQSRSSIMGARPGAPGGIRANPMGGLVPRPGITAPPNAAAGRTTTSAVPATAGATASPAAPASTTTPAEPAAPATPPTSPIPVTAPTPATTTGPAPATSK